MLQILKTGMSLMQKMSLGSRRAWPNACNLEQGYIQNIMMSFIA